MHSSQIGRRKRLLVRTSVPWSGLSAPQVEKLRMLQRIEGVTDCAMEKGVWDAAGEGVGAAAVGQQYEWRRGWSQRRRVG